MNQKLLMIVIIILKDDTDKNGNGESSDNYPNIYDDLTFYAKWYKYCTNTYIKSTKCSKNCGGGKKLTYFMIS